MIQKKLQGNFTIADNRIMQCDKLSFEARGLYFYMLSLPNNWNFSEERLAKNGGMGITKIKRILAELFDIGLLKRSFTNDDKGFKKSIYTLFDFETSENPMLVNPMLVNPMLVNPMNIKEPYIQITKDNKELYNNIPPTFKEPNSKELEPLKDSPPKNEQKNLEEFEIKIPEELFEKKKKETPAQKYKNAMEQFFEFKKNNPTCCVTQEEWGKWLSSIIKTKGSKFSYTAQIKQLNKSLKLDNDFVHFQIEKATLQDWQGLHLDENSEGMYLRNKKIIESQKTDKEIRQEQIKNGRYGNSKYNGFDDEIYEKPF